ncbi:MAG: molybdopterin molybdotransferase MoeA [Candidatus Desulfofervidaceae bacterium]|nr:molybdopterin molybdotransferase MoeA [Candidatus Desulfofervidaceae bacterium]
MRQAFFSTKLPQEVFDSFSNFHPVSKEELSLENALGCVLAEDFIAPEDLPGFPRATMDGYAVRAEDTFGTSEAVPVWLKVTGEIKMGEVPQKALNREEAIKIATGGMLPEGANAVVMVEHTQPIDETTIEVFKPVAPLENITLAGEDFSQGTLVLPQGHRLRPQDIGVLASLGKDKVRVYQCPRVAIISTGDEVVPVTEKIRPGQVRDVNSYTLSALVEESRCIPVRMGIVKDDFQTLRKACQKALEKADVVLLSGGSSVGVRDFTLEVIRSFASSEILCHGVSISPGKPTIFARVGEKAVWGLPGQVTSAIIVFLVLVKPFLHYISGEKVDFSFQPLPIKTITVRAKMKVNVPSVQGREDYLRVKLKEEDGILWAEPILGKSGLLNTLIKADGLVKIDLNVEGLDKGEEVEVALF